MVSVLNMDDKENKLGVVPKILAELKGFSVLKLCIVLFLSPFPLLAVFHGEQFRLLYENLFKNSMISVLGWLLSFSLIFLLAFNIKSYRKQLDHKNKVLKKLQTSESPNEYPTLSEEDD